jgi:hypothetical protein
MESILGELIKQAPSAVATLIVVIYFVNYITKRDVQETKKSDANIAAITKLTMTITAVSENQASHHDAMIVAIRDMKQETREIKRTKK